MVIFGVPPALRMASIITVVRPWGTAGSCWPWNAQIGRFFNFVAWAVSPPPQMGTAAAKSPGLRAAASHVP